MACYAPLTAWYGLGKTKNGKKPIVFKPSESAAPFNTIELPCGQCLGCKLDYSRSWALRAVHEQQTANDQCCFVTLTYKDETLPQYGTLKKEDLQKWLKRLRKQLGKKIRFLACGEYGEDKLRPHYHAILFGHKFSKDKFVKSTKSGSHIWQSEELDNSWSLNGDSLGFASFGDMTFKSAAYVARYTLKKAKDESGEEDLQRYSMETGEVFPSALPTFGTMSRNGGLGKEWFLTYRKDCFPHDFIVHDTKKYPVPRYYEKVWQDHFPEEYAEQMPQIKKARLSRAKVHADNNTPERRAVRERIHQLKARKLQRELQ